MVLELDVALLLGLLPVLVMGKLAVSVLLEAVMEARVRDVLLLLRREERSLLLLLLRLGR